MYSLFWEKNAYEIYTNSTDITFCVCVVLKPIKYSILVTLNRANKLERLKTKSGFFNVFTFFNYNLLVSFKIF